MENSVTNFTANENGINRTHRKENNFDGERAIFTVDADGSINKKISCRLYSTQATSFCCIWISGKGEMYSGSGKAGGYGYNRMSSAAQDAINGAGFKLQYNIGGVGESAVDGALMAIAEYLGYVNPQLITSHP